jgi:hypothetical protein
MFASDFKQSTRVPLRQIESVQPVDGGMAHVTWIDAAGRVCTGRTPLDQLLIALGWFAPLAIERAQRHDDAVLRDMPSPSAEMH